MNNIIDTIKTTSQIAVPRAYIIACTCQIETMSKEIVFEIVQKDSCPRLFTFLEKKRLIGDLNFKWKEKAFQKFTKQFGDDLYQILVIELGKQSLDINRINNAFETLGSNRNYVAHENGNLSLTIEEIEDNFKVCYEAMQIFKRSL